MAPTSIPSTMWRSTEFHVTPGFWGMLALGVLWGALDVLPLVLMAAVCHELGHLAALRLMGITVKEINLTAMGAVIVAPGQERLSYGRELAAVLAGAGTTFVLALLFARVSGDYLLAGANALLGIYNLLPLRGLDGGRALWLAVAWAREPFTATAVAGRVNLVTMALLMGFSLLLLWETGGGLFCLLAAAGLALSQILERIRAGRIPGKQGCQTGKKQIQYMG